MMEDVYLEKWEKSELAKTIEFTDDLFEEDEKEDEYSVLIKRFNISDLQTWFDIFE